MGNKWGIVYTISEDIFIIFYLNRRCNYEFHH